MLMNAAIDCSTPYQAAEQGERLSFSYGDERIYVERVSRNAKRASADPGSSGLSYRGSGWGQCVATRGSGGTEKARSLDLPAVTLFSFSQ